MAVDVPRTRSLLRDEFRELAAFATDLPTADWARPTACEGWTVRDVIAHVVAWDELFRLPSRRWWPVKVGVHLGRLARARGSVDRVNARLGDAWADVAPDALLAALDAAARAPVSRLFDRIAPGAQLAEVVVHHEDIRHALGRPRSIAPPRLRAALDGVRRLGGVGATRRLRHARYVATDLGWEAGQGDVVRAPGASILMTLAGR